MYKKPATPPDEPRRLAALKALKILDTVPEERFDRLTRLAQALFSVPIALVSLVDANRQWFKSRQGLAAAWTPRDISFCGHAILDDATLVVPDAKRDSRFKDNPLVIHQPRIRFYAGCPLSAMDGSKLGTLCIIDRKPRKMSRKELQLLKDLSALVEKELNSVELNEALALLRESKEQFQDLLDNANDMIQSVTTEGRFLYVNNAWRKALGYQDQDLGKLNMFDIIHPDSRSHCEEAFRCVLSGESVSGIEAIFVAKDGRPVVVEGSVNCHFKKGRPFSTRGIFRDITRRKRAEEESLKLRRAVEEGPSIVMITDKDGAIEYINPRFSDVTGLSKEDVLGSSAMALGEQSPEEAGRLWQALSAGQVWRGVFKNRKKGGGYYWEAAAIAPIKNSRGKITHFVKVGEDITERKEMEEKLRRHRDQLEELVAARTGELRETEEQYRQAQKMEAVGRLAGGIAHDFNNLLMVITGYAELIRLDLKTDDRILDELDEILKAAKRAASLTRQLLVFSRKSLIQPKVLILNSVVTDMEKMLRRIIGENIKLVVRLAADLGPIQADPGYMEQVLLNLAVNGKDAMAPGGTLTIETAAVELKQETMGREGPIPAGRYVLLTVGDTGAGMSSEVQAKIFEPFFTTKGEGKGTGLGLSTVHGIVKQSGGHVTFESALGRGTTFRIYLPRVDEADVEDARSARSDETFQGAETILLVEDEALVRELTGRVLRSFGYTVHEAGNATQALEFCRQNKNRIDLVLTDLIMPEMSGGDLAEKIGALCPQVKFLFMTGYTDPDILQHDVFEQGGRLLQKPVSPELLAHTVREILDARRSG